MFDCLAGWLLGWLLGWLAGCLLGCCWLLMDGSFTCCNTWSLNHVLSLDIACRFPQGSHFQNGNYGRSNIQKKQSENIFPPKQPSCNTGDLTQTCTHLNQSSLAQSIAPSFTHMHAYVAPLLLPPTCSCSAMVLDLHTPWK
jgi:hypothetical protein